VTSSSLHPGSPAPVAGALRVRVVWDAAPRPLAAILGVEPSVWARIELELDTHDDVLRIDAMTPDPVRIATRAPAGAAVERRGRWVRVLAPGMLDLSARRRRDGTYETLYARTGLMGELGLDAGRYDGPRVTLTPR